MGLKPENAVQIYELSYIHLHSSPSTGILPGTRKLASSQWLDSLVGRALHGIAEVMGSNPVQA